MVTPLADTYVGPVSRSDEQACVVLIHGMRFSGDLGFEENLGLVLFERSKDDLGDLVPLFKPDDRIYAWHFLE